MTKRFVEGITVNSETIARDVITAIGPGGHFMEHTHTFEHFRDELWTTNLFDRQPIAAWQAAGQPAIEDRVREKIRAIIDTHEPEPLSSNIVSELERIGREGEKEILAKYEQG